jgi:hypothetical protein
MVELKKDWMPTEDAETVEFFVCAVEEGMELEACQRMKVIQGG